MSFRADFEELCRIGADPAGGWTRPAFSPAENAAHDWLRRKGRAAGLAVRSDAIGNTILRLGGEGPAILIGSHLDTVPNGGALDGALGVLAGLEVARRLAAEGAAGAPVEVIAFRDEEGRFGPFTGSRAMAGLHDPEALRNARAPEGESLSDAARAAGFAAVNAPRDWAEVALWLELHIEQGPVLEATGLPLGIVTSIAGQERLSVRFMGRADHAGTAPMHLRRDALAGAARFATGFRDLILAQGDPDLRGTIGVVKISPNQGNVVPATATLGLEIRATDGDALPGVRDAVEALAGAVAGEEGLELRLRRLWSDRPVPMDARLRRVLGDAAATLGVPALALPSGANHDTGIIGRIVPAAMLFVPSTGGRSHCPEEATPVEQIEAAIDVLHLAVQRLRGAPS